jgi:hypothetical protein
VVSVFIPPREPGFQAMIESYHGQWQAKVWARFSFDARGGVEDQSGRYVAAVRRRRADRIESAPCRRPFPKRWRLNLQEHPPGRMVYLRRTNASGAVDLLGRNFAVDAHWLLRLVRVELDLDEWRMRFHSLRRRGPTMQPMLREIDYQILSTAHSKYGLAILRGPRLGLVVLGLTLRHDLRHRLRGPGERERIFLPLANQGPQSLSPRLLAGTAAASRRFRCSRPNPRSTGFLPEPGAGG